MKEITLIAYIVIVATLPSVQSQNKFLDGAYDVFALINGNVLRIRDSNQVRLQSPITLDDGTLVNLDGSYRTDDHQSLQS